MRIARSIVAGLGAMAVSHVCAAPTLGATMLGRLEGILAFCSQANPDKASAYRENIEQMLAGFAQGDLAEARKTEAYRTASESTAEQLGKLPHEQALASCEGKSE